MPGFLESIEDLRDVEWDQGYLWDIRFDETINRAHHRSFLTAPFDRWFPANTVSDQRFSMAEQSFEIHQYAGFPLPTGSQQRTVTITFYDNIYSTLLKWLTLWVKSDILNDGKYLTSLIKCTKTLQIVKLNSQRDQLETFSYLVIPTGTIDYQGTEHADSIAHTVSFLIVGEEHLPVDSSGFSTNNE